MPTRKDLLAARSCVASARQALQDAIPIERQKVRNSKADYAATCLLMAANLIKR